MKNVEYTVIAGFAQPKNGGCEANPCENPGAQSDNLVYVGPNLPCTGIRTCESLSVALQKIDKQICDLKKALFNLTTTTTTTTMIPT